MNGLELWDVLCKYECEGWLFSALYNGRKAGLRIDGMFSKQLNLEQRVRKWDVMHFWSFNMFIGLLFRDGNACGLPYADHAVLLVKNANNPP